METWNWLNIACFALCREEGGSGGENQYPKLLTVHSWSIGLGMLFTKVEPL